MFFSPRLQILIYSVALTALGAPARAQSLARGRGSIETKSEVERLAPRAAETLRARSWWRKAVYRSGWSEGDLTQALAELGPSQVVAFTTLLTVLGETPYTNVNGASTQARFDLARAYLALVGKQLDAFAAQPAYGLVAIAKVLRQGDTPTLLRVKRIVERARELELSATTAGDRALALRLAVDQENEPWQKGGADSFFAHTSFDGEWVFMLIEPNDSAVGASRDVRLTRVRYRAPTSPLERATAVAESRAFPVPQDTHVEFERVAADPLHYDVVGTLNGARAVLGRVDTRSGEYFPPAQYSVEDLARVRGAGLSVLQLELLKLQMLPDEWAAFQKMLHLFPTAEIPGVQSAAEISQRALAFRVLALRARTNFTNSLNLAQLWDEVIEGGSTEDRTRLIAAFDQTLRDHLAAR